MGSSTISKAWEQEVSTTDSPGVESSSPVRGKFFAVYTILADLTEWSIYGKNSIVCKLRNNEEIQGRRQTSSEDWESKMGVHYG